MLYEGVVRYRISIEPEARDHVHRVRFVTADKDTVLCTTTLRCVSVNDVCLYTPSHGTCLFRIVEDVTELRLIWPFRSLTYSESQLWWQSIADALCTPWYPVGCAGERLDERGFYALYLVFLDWYGAVYCIDVNDYKYDIYRVADDLDCFFAMGFLKVIPGKRRFESDKSRKTRFEINPVCPHVDEVSIANMGRVMRLNRNENLRLSQRQLQQYYDWICCEERYIDQAECWEERDVNTVVVHRSDTLCNPRIYNSVMEMKYSGNERLEGDIPIWRLKPFVGHETYKSDYDDRAAVFEKRCAGNDGYLVKCISGVRPKPDI